MTYLGSMYKEPTGTRMYIPTDKEPLVEGAGMATAAYWALTTRIQEVFGAEGATLPDIYDKIGRPLRLSSQDTSDLLKGARSAGFLTYHV